MDIEAKKRIVSLLDRKYHILCNSLTEAESGWTALGYKVTDKERSYYLKVYDKHKHTAQPWITRIDDYIPLLLWFEQSTGLRDRVPSVILSCDGAYKLEDTDSIYILFDYIDGHNLHGKSLSEAQITELAEIVAMLHSIRDNVPVPLEGVNETFDTSFCKNLSNTLQHGECPADLEHILASSLELIQNRIQVYENLAAYLRSTMPQFVLCHTDIHCWNVMQDRRIKLIDWEGVRFAPAEADLFSFSEGFFFENIWNDFMSKYSEFRPDFRLNQEALRFYRMRRLLEDIDAFSEGLLYDNLVGAEREPSLNLLQNCCLLLKKIS